ncbi:MAG: ATP-dependent RNA helicase, partial [Bacteriovoracaceae bacterium]|nr:ATP-dependent RNA helicase [Bacteriovoracaceae bacterium]
MILEPNKFPIDSFLDDIAQAIDTNSCVLIKAETGAGKTTRLPPYLLSRTQGKVLVLEPRRLAAKLSAQRCAQTVESKIGELVGHHIRFDKSVGADTRLTFITEGLFLPYLREDPELSEYSTIIIDEFHERNIHTDLALALTRKLQKTLRPDLKLVVMSATLETDKLETYLDSPKVFNIKGRTFPIEIEYHPPLEHGGRKGKESWESNAKRAIINLLEEPKCTKNILVFLPGMGAIRLLEQQLRSVVTQDIEIVPLHSTLPKAIQNKAFTGDNRKIILSTNIAETSLTIPNITGVVDLGTERRASFAPWSGMPLLQLEKISKASATQRAGRAGRVQSGIVYRLYSESQFSQREAFTPPEIKRVELSHHILDVLDLGLHPDSIDWFEAPEEKNLNTALELLEMLGACKDSRPTQMGHFLAQLPLHPRLGAMLFNCPSHLLSDALLAACIISESMVLSKNAQFSSDDEEVCDLCIQIDLIKAYHHKDNDISDYDLSYLDQRKAKRVLELFNSLSSRFKIKTLSKDKTSHQDLVVALLKGFPDRVAAKREVKKGKRSIQSYNFCLGRGGKFSIKSALSYNSPNYIIVLDALEDPKA